MAKQWFLNCALAAVLFVSAPPSLAGTCIPMAAARRDCDADGIDDACQVPQLSIGDPRAALPATTPETLAIADFDGDGDLDAAIRPHGKNEIQIFLRNRQANFTLKATIPVPQYLLWLDAGDLNGDGSADLAGGADDLFVFMNRGDAAFPSANMALKHPSSLGALIDTDGDRDLDIVTAAPQGMLPGIDVSTNSGNGTFAAARSFAVLDSEVRRLVRSDLDGDGRADLAAVTSDNVTLLLPEGLGSARVHVLDSSNVNPQSVAFAELTGDRRADLVYVGQEGATILRNEGAGRFEPWRSIPLPTDSSRFPDATVVVASAPGGVHAIVVQLESRLYVFREESVGLYVLGAPVTAIGRMLGLAPDLDSDASPELFFLHDGYNRPRVFIGTLDSLFTPRPSIVPPAQFGQGGPVAIGDVNGDRTLDLVAADLDSPASTPSRLHTLIGGPNGFSYHSSVAVSSHQIGSVLLFDDDEDGDLDAVTTPSLGVRFLRNDGGTFAVGRRVEAKGSSVRLAAEPVDLDGDGHHEVVVAEDGGILIVPNAKSRSAEWRVPLGAPIESVAISDFDLDGDPDLVAVGKGISVILENVGGHLKNAFHLGTDGSSVVAADLDGDRLDDVAISTIGETDLVSVFRNRGGFFFSRVGSFEIPLALGVVGLPPVLATADVNHDGLTDILAGVRSTLAVFLNSGSGILGRAWSYPVFGAPRSIDVLTGGLRDRFIIGQYRDNGPFEMLENRTAASTHPDCDFNGVPDVCEALGNDCNGNGVLDSCEPDGDGDGIPDSCDFCRDSDDRLDRDRDGWTDCTDNCPSVANSPQTDFDGDGAGNACDPCGNDPDKVEPGICGCGWPEGDRDGDKVPDCYDGCPDTSWQVAPGLCGCGVSSSDADGDGDSYINCVDNCEEIANPDQLDSDGDGHGDACDECPVDPAKQVPGFCGCGATEPDRDGDRTPDCADECPDNPARKRTSICGCVAPDADHDGAFDCEDECPFDSLKKTPGICGCGIPDSRPNEPPTGFCPTRGATRTPSATPTVTPTKLAGPNTWDVDDPSDLGDVEPGDQICRARNGQCTLRAAIQEANASRGTDHIRVPAGEYVLTITGAKEDSAVSGDLDINDPVEITGAGNELTIIDGNSLDRVLEIDSGISVAITGVTIRRGKHTEASFPVPRGIVGGILNRGQLRMRAVKFLGNEAIGTSRLPGAGGVVNFGTFECRECEFRGNTTDGAVAIANHGSAEVETAVIASNSGFSGVDNSGEAVMSFVAFYSNATVTAISNSGDLRLSDSSSIGHIGGSYAGLANASTGKMDVLRTHLRLHVGWAIDNAGSLTLLDSSIFGSSSQESPRPHSVFNGILNKGRATIARSSIQFTEGSDGAAVLNEGECSLSNVTISDNFGGDQGSGVRATAGTVELDFVTVTRNRAGAYAGLEVYPGARAFLRNSIIAGNIGEFGAGTDCRGRIESGGHNIIGDRRNCMVAALASDHLGASIEFDIEYNLGMGPITYVPLAGSPAIDGADPSSCPETDQLGALRPSGVSCDIGAIEAGALVPTPTPEASPTPSPSPRPDSCSGDCDGSGSVTVDEIVKLVNLALGANGGRCTAGDLDGSGTITVDELLTAVAKALSGCG